MCRQCRARGGHPFAFASMTKRLGSRLEDDPGGWPPWSAHTGDRMKRYIDQHDILVSALVMSVHVAPFNPRELDEPVSSFDTQSQIVARAFHQVGFDQREGSGICLEADCPSWLLHCQLV